MRPILAVGTLDSPMRHNMKQRIPSMTTVSSHVSSMKILLLLLLKEAAAALDDMMILSFFYIFIVCWLWNR